jgi:flagellar capping protein FliD
VNRTRKLASLVLPAALVVTPLLASTHASAATSTTSILSAAKSALASQHSVHMTVSVKQGSTTTIEEADLGTSTGIESIISGSAKATVEVAPAFGYMEGDSAGLTSLIGLTAAEAKKLGTKWMSLKAGTTPYSDLKTAATIPAVRDLLPAVKGTSSSTETVGNTKFYILKWTSAATSSAPKLSNVLSISMGKSVLPVKEVVSDSTATETTEFTRWGENVVVNAPAASATVPYTTIVKS